MTKKHLFELGLFVLIAAIFVAGGAKMFLGDKVRTVTEQVEVQSEMEINTDFSAWQTYVNDEYGFKLQYPPTWYMSTTGSLTLYDRVVEPNQTSVNNTITFLPKWDKKYPAYNRNKNESLDTYAKRFVDYAKGPGELIEVSGNYLSDKYSDVYQVSTKTIDTNPIYGCESQPCPEPPQKNVEYRTITTYIPQGDSVFIIQAKMRGDSKGNVKIDSQEEKQYIEKYQQIISTFKFENVFGAMGWKTYKNEQYGFSVKYPDGWAVEEKKDTSTKNLPIFYVYKIDANSEVDLDGNVTKVRIAPQGIGHNEIILPAAKVSTFIVKNQKKGFQSFLKNGDMWAMWLQFLKQPDSWSEEGLIFYSAQVNNKLPYCELNGQKVDNNQCGYDAPGKYVMEGALDDQADNQIAEDILSSFVFTDTVYEPDCCG